MVTYINSNQEKSLRCVKSNAMIPSELLKGKNIEKVFGDTIILAYKSRWFISVKITSKKCIQKGNRMGYPVKVVTDCLLTQKDNAVNNDTISLFELDEIIKHQNKTKLPALNQKSYSSSEIMELSSHQDVVTLIQIIGSAHNHATVHGKYVTNCSKRIICRKNGRLILKTINLHYCKKCNRYFDFTHSFYRQLEKLNIKRNDLYAILINDKNKEIHYISGNMQLNEESRLKILGYNSSLSTLHRHRLLKDIVRNNLLSIAEMKTILEFLIKFVGSQERMKNSRDIWESDISFLNTLMNNF